MKKQALKSMLILIFLTVMLGSCSFATSRKAKDVIYQSNKVKVTETTKIPDTDGQVTTTTDWITIDEDELFDRSPIIFVGKLKNLKTANLEYNHLDQEISQKILIFDMEIEKTYRHDTEKLKEKKTLTLSLSSEESFYEGMIPHLKEGSSYLMFCSPATDVIDEDIKKLELDKFMDCIPQTPIGTMLERVSENLFITSEFMSLKVTNTKILSLIKNRTAFLNQVLISAANQRTYLIDKVQFDDLAFTNNDLTENLARQIVESVLQRSVFSNNIKELFESAGIVSEVLINEYLTQQIQSRKASS